MSHDMNNDNKNAKGIDNVENTSLSSVFKRLNAEDSLSPSAELDALILKQAADAVATSTESEAVTQKPKIERDSPIDIKFRRQQLEAERARQRKKTSFLPAWAMPMALAATVLLSFGVVTRVMQSPEFSKPVGTEYMSEVQVSDMPLSDNRLSEESAYGASADLSFESADSKTEKESLAPVKASRLKKKDNGAVLEALTTSPHKTKNTCTSGSNCDAPEMSAAERTAIDAAKAAKQQRQVLATVETMQRTAQPRSAAVTADLSTTNQLETEAQPSVHNAKVEKLSTPSISSASPPPPVMHAENESRLTVREVIDANATTSGAEVKEILTDEMTIPLKHKTCNKRFDCSLIKRDHDETSCENVIAINNDFIHHYEAFYSVAAAEKQCPLNVAECEEGYCEVTTVK